MSRRFTLFALLTAVCLLFASCGALFLKTPVSNKGSIVIPLRASDRKASNPLELCTRFVFSIENASYKDTAEGTTTIEFGEIPFGTYTLTGTAYGKLSEETGAQEEIVATCKVENLVIDSPEPKAVTATFVLSEATLIYFNGYEVEDEDADGNPVTIVFTGTDKTTKISETKTTETQGVTTTTVIEYAIDANGNNTLKTDGTLFHAKETVTEPQSSGNKITVTEYDYNAGHPQVSKTTVTEPDGKKTISEYNLNATTQGCAKRVTVEEGNTTTVSKYDTDEDSSLKEIEVTQKTSAVTTITTYNGSNWEGNLFAKQVVIDSGNGTTTTTENLSTNKAKTAKVTVEVTSGSDKGKTTVTEYDTAAAGTVRETVTVTNPDHSSVVTTFNDSDKETKKVETDASGVQTTSLYNYTTNASSQQVTTVTTYQAGRNLDDGTEADPNDYHIARTVAYTLNSDGTTASITTSEFDYTDVALTVIHYDQYNNVVTPYDSVEVTVEENGSTVVTKTSYTYCDGEVKSNNPLGRQASKTIETTVNGVKSTVTETYTYDKGRIIKEESTAPGYTTKEWEYIQKSCVVYDRGSSMKEYTAYSEADILFTIPKNDENAMRVAKDSAVDEATVLRFLTNNYVLCGDTEDDLNWVMTDKAGKDTSSYLRSRTIKGASTEGLYNYIYKINHSYFASEKPGCMSVTVVGDTAYVIVHNSKSGCNNFWGRLASWKYTDPETNTVLNYGAAGNSKGVGGN